MEEEPVGRIEGPPNDTEAERRRLAGMLGVDAASGPDEVRDAYKRLVKIHHPDRGGDPDFMLVINDAYERWSALPPADQVDVGLGAPGDGWTWAGDEEPEPVGAGGVVRTVVSFVVLPAAALTLVLLAWWFITVLS